MSDKFAVISRENETYYVDSTTKCIVVDHLFHSPLYAWWVVVIDLFDPNDIKGTLLDLPVQFWGPHETREDAENAAISYMNDTPMNSQPS